MGSGLATLPSLVIVQRYFNKRRGFAGGIAILGLSAGTLVSPPLINLAINYYGWRGATLLQAGVILHTLILASAFRPVPKGKTSQHLKKDNENLNDKRISSRCFLCGVRPHTPPGSIIDWSLFKEASFMLFCFGSLCQFGGVMSYFQHLVSRAVFDGVPQDKAVILPVIMGIFTVCNRILFSLIIDLKCINRILFYSMGVFIGAAVSLLTAFVANDFITIAVCAAMLSTGVGMFEFFSL